MTVFPISLPFYPAKQGKDNQKHSFCSMAEKKNLPLYQASPTQHINEKLRDFFMILCFPSEIIC